MKTKLQNSGTQCTAWHIENPPHMLVIIIFQQQKSPMNIGDRIRIVRKNVILPLK